MNKQKLATVVMVPVVFIALFMAWKSFKASQPEAAPEHPVSSKDAAGAGGGGGAMGGGGGGGQRQPPTPQQTVDNMSKDLTLTADQQPKILAIEEDLAAKRKALPQTMSRDEKRKQNQAYRKEAEAKIKAILTPDQVKKYDEIQEKRRAQMQAMRGGGGPGGPGGPGSGGRMGGPGGGMGGPGGPGMTKPAGGPTSAPATKPGA